MPKSAASASAWPSPTFCVLPWVHLFCDQGGSIEPCCMMIPRQHLLDARNVDADGRPYPIYEPDAIARGWNSPMMRRLRRELLAGERPDVCADCFQLEAIGGSSHRLEQNALLGDRIDSAVRATDADCRVPPQQIRTMNLLLGNTCNLRCRMCSPIASYATGPDWRALHAPSPGQPHRIDPPRYDWYRAPTFLEGLAPLLAQVERLSLAGGEPLVIGETRDLLQVLIDAGHAGAVRAKLFSNLTRLPDWLIETAAQFRQFKLVASIDGLGPLNGYIRHPARWEDIQANLQLLDGLCGKTGTPLALQVNVTVQAYNLLGLDALIRHLAEAYRHVQPPGLVILGWPECLGIQVLPAPAKALAAARLKRLLDWCSREAPEHWRGKGLAELTRALAGLLAHLDAADRTALLPELKRQTLLLDRLRGESLRAVAPELADLLGGLES